MSKKINTEKPLEVISVQETINKVINQPEEPVKVSESWGKKKSK